MSSQKYISHLQKHPAIKQSKLGVLLINLGTPDDTTYFAVRRYLSEFLSDKRVIDYPAIFWQPLLQLIILTTRPFRSGHAYKQIWDKKTNLSPLLMYTKKICEKLAAQTLHKKHNIEFSYAMRYGNPSIASQLDKLHANGCNKILLFALYPQYSDTTTATAYDKAFDKLKKMTWQPSIRTTPAWHDDDEYINIMAKSIQDQLDKIKHPVEMIVTSFHGLPKRYLKNGDPYYCFCQKTSRLLREKINWPVKQWVTTFQSRFGPEKWLTPYTDKTVEKLAQQGVKNIAIVSPAFICDCLETLEEIAIQVKDIFIKAGGKNYHYIPCLNDSPANINFLSAKIKNELAGWL